MSIYDIPLIFILVMLAGGFWCSRYERRIWNGGKCLKHGFDWIYFDSTSNGDRGYKCQQKWPKGTCCTWQSYGHDEDQLGEVVGIEDEYVIRRA